MSEPVKLAVEPEQERRARRCVELLERFLGEAKEGLGFEQVFIIATRPDTTRLRTGWPAGVSMLDVLGRIEFLKHELLQDSRDWDEEGG